MTRYNLTQHHQGQKRLVCAYRFQVSFYLTKNYAIALLTDYLFVNPKVRCCDLTKTKFEEIMRQQLTRYGEEGRAGLNGYGTQLGTHIESWKRLEREAEEWIQKNVAFEW